VFGSKCSLSYRRELFCEEWWSSSPVHPSIQNVARLALLKAINSVSKPTSHFASIYPNLPTFLRSAKYTQIEDLQINSRPDAKNLYIRSLNMLRTHIRVSTLAYGSGELPSRFGEASNQKSKRDSPLVEIVGGESIQACTSFQSKSVMDEGR
jgi:hypothetical protein